MWRWNEHTLLVVVRRNLDLLLLLLCTRNWIITKFNTDRCVLGETGRGLSLSYGFFDQYYNIYTIRYKNMRELTPAVRFLARTRGFAFFQKIKITKLRRLDLRHFTLATHTWNQRRTIRLTQDYNQNKMHQSIFDKLPFGGYVLFSPGTHHRLLNKSI